MKQIYFLFVVLLVVMVLVVMQEDGSGFTVVCDHIVSHCDDLIYTHITKGYAS